MAYWDSAARNNNSIASVLHQALGEKHRYIGTGAWEYTTQEGVWVVDPTQTMLRKAITAESSKVIERLLYWSQVEGTDAQLRCEILSDISMRLKNPKHANAIIREAREFFIVE